MTLDPLTLAKRDIFYTSPDGLMLYAADYGPEDAPLTVLCMHGLTRNHKDFEPMIDGLSLPFRFISVDVRGRGRSERDQKHSYLPPVYAEDMRALLDHLELDKVALIGTSMGGLMSMIMTHTMPERIRGIVLNDIGPAVNRHGLERIAQYTSGVKRFSCWEEAAKVIADTQADLFPEYDDADWLAFAHRTCRQEDDGSIIFDYDPAITDNMGQAIPGWRAQFLMWRLFGRMKKIPLLVIRGAHSDILALSAAKRMCRRHKDCELVKVPDRGHAPLLDEPAALSAIEKFLKRLAA